MPANINFFLLLVLLGSLPIQAGEKIPIIDAPNLASFICNNDKNKFEKICEKITEICEKSIFKSRDCANNSPRESDLKEFSSYFVDRIRKMTNNSEKIKVCCGDDMVCNKNLSSTAVQILTGVKNGVGRDGYYHYNKEFIGIYKTALLKLGNKENIDSFLHHEFGHACSLAKNRELLNLNSDKTIEYIKRRLGDILDKPTYECVKEAIEERAKLRAKEKIKIDKSSWYEEAYADLAFAIGRRTVANYAVDCHYKEDERHAEPKIYFKCFLQSEAVRKVYCEHLDERIQSKKLPSPPIAR